MELKQFADWVHGRWTKNPRREDLAIMTLGLCGECGEVSEPIKKLIRGTHKLNRDALALELGDVLHYWCAIAKRFDLDVEEIIKSNIAKLEAREAVKPDYFNTQETK